MTSGPATPASGAGYRFGDFVLLPAARQLLRHGAPVELEAKVFDLIALLVARRERALGKREIVDALWGHRPVTDAALSQLVYKARRALDDDGRAAIRTVYGRGLQWVAPVQALDETVPAARSPASYDAPASDGDVPPAPRPARRRRSIAAVALALCVLAVWRLVAHDGNTSVREMPHLAVLPIENATGDDALAWTSQGLAGLISSLLDQHGKLEVVDPLVVARMSQYAATRQRDRAARVRQATGAAILVRGRLRKLSSLYELDLRIERAGHAAGDIVLHGTEPGALAAAAVPRLRAELGLTAAADHALAESPRDPYLAQTFARGMEAAMRGRWAEAKPYFAVVAQADADFLPARLRLGQAQGRGDRPEEAPSTLRGVVDAASRRDLAGLAARALRELAYQATTAHQFDTAASLLDEARPFAARADDPELDALLRLDAANVHASLDRRAEAETDLDAARKLIARQSLQHLRPNLLQSEIFVANGRDDMQALETAAREAVAANEALGNERGSHAALFNLAFAVANQNRAAEALPLYARTWAWARDHRDYPLTARAGSMLAEALASAGLADEAAGMQTDLLSAAREHGDRFNESLALLSLAGLRLATGDEREALRLGRESEALVDANENPNNFLGAATAEAFAALGIEPRALAGIAHRVDALPANVKTKRSNTGTITLLQALEASAQSDGAGARQALERAFAAPETADDEDEARQTALWIALAGHDDAAAAIGLHGFDPMRCDEALTLHLAQRWAVTQGDTELQRKSAQRLAELRARTLAALGDDWPALRAAPAGATAESPSPAE